MRIQLLSDLHLEYGGDIPPLAPGAEVVLLAGDLAPAVHRAVRLPAEIWGAAARADAGNRNTARVDAGKRDAPHILYVPGNHEFHGADIEEARQLLARDCAACGVTLLDTEAVTIGHVRFIGATLWTDFRLYGEERQMECRRAAGERFGDFTGLIRDRAAPEGLFTPREAVRRHIADRAFIEAEIAAAHAAGLEAAVVTHHAPSPVSVHWRHAGSPANPAFVSDLEDLMVHLRPVLWVHGHVHHAVSATVGRTHVIANPLGIGPTEEADFTPDLVVEL